MCNSLQYTSESVVIMILCVTPNAALDRTVVVPDFAAGAVYRAQQVSVVAGGKGMNVARALQIFGSQVLCTGFIAGPSGKFFADIAEAEGFIGKWTNVAGDTRTCTSIADPNLGETTVVNEPGPTVTAADWQILQSDTLNAAADAAYICISGSLPPGSPLDSFTSFIQAMPNNVWVDTSGAPLIAAVAAGPTGIKVNHLEASVITEYQIHTFQDAARTARTIHERGISTVIITMGKMGAVFADRDDAFYAIAPKIHAVSTVASGDVFFAGLIHALANGASGSEALRHGVAAGAANALTVGGGQFQMSDFNRLLEETSVERISH